MATTWKIDTTHSEIQFKVKHLMISTVTGYFKTFDRGSKQKQKMFKLLNAVHLQQTLIRSVRTMNNTIRT